MTSELLHNNPCEYVVLYSNRGYNRKVGSMILLAPFLKDQMRSLK